MRVPALLLAATCIAAPAALSQGLGGGQGGPPPLPDHWLTLDSLAGAVGLSADQRGKVTEPYTALNAVMKDAAAKRAAMRERMMKEMGGRTFADLTDADRARLRAVNDSIRPELQAMQDEADMWHQTIRSLLTTDQQAKFDALPKPLVFRQMRRGGPGPN
jgi:hypothetical protein